MCLKKSNNGNILICASIFLVLAALFLTSMFKITTIINKKEKNINVYNSGLELSKSNYEILEEAQKEIINIEKIEVEKRVEVKKGLFVTLKEKGVGEVLQDNKTIPIYWKKEKLCSCKEKDCSLKSEKIILIPKRRID